MEEIVLKHLESVYNNSLKYYSATSTLKVTYATKSETKARRYWNNIADG